MRLPSGTRMSLLLAFAFVLITSEFPEFSGRGRGRLGNLLLQGPKKGGEVATMFKEGSDYEYDDNGKGRVGDEGDEVPSYLSEANSADEVQQQQPRPRMSIFVEATYYKHHHHGGYRKWGCGGCECTIRSKFIRLYLQFFLFFLGGGYRRMSYGNLLTLT